MGKYFANVNIVAIYDLLLSIFLHEKIAIIAVLPVPLIIKFTFSRYFQKLFKDMWLKE